VSGQSTPWWLLHDQLQVENGSSYSWLASSAALWGYEPMTRSKAASRIAVSK
jgi:hypothetical protein